MSTKEKVIALGFFDGVHLGHQALVAQCLRLAEDRGAEPAAITFQKHPQSLFTSNPPALINTAADRERLLKQFGIQYIHSIPVTKEVMSTNWQDFLENLQNHGAAGFVCGNDFRFGRLFGLGRLLRGFTLLIKLQVVEVTIHCCPVVNIKGFHLTGRIQTVIVVVCYNIEFECSVRRCRTCDFRRECNCQWC